MTLTKTLLALALALLVTACEQIGPTIPDQVCAGWKPIDGEPQDVDAISDTLALSIAAHQANGRALGCWP